MNPLSCVRSNGPTAPLRTSNNDLPPKNQGYSVEETAARIDLRHHEDSLGISEPGADMLVVQRIYDLADGLAE